MGVASSKVQNRWGLLFFFFAARWLRCQLTVINCQNHEITAAAPIRDTVQYSTYVQLDESEPRVQCSVYNLYYISKITVPSPSSGL
jgi:hypothetical protein